MLLLGLEEILLWNFIPIQSEHFMTQVSRNTETIKKTQIADKPDISIPNSKT